MKGIIDVLLWVWQFPQHIVGFIMSCIWRTKVFRDVEMQDGVHENVRFYMYPYNSVSLGDYRFIRYNSGDLTYRHETGHSVDSRRWGWLYLLVIGLPSAMTNLLFRIPSINAKYNYYHTPWEKSADRNAGIER